MEEVREFPPIETDVHGNIFLTRRENEIGALFGETLVNLVKQREAPRQLEDALTILVAYKKEVRPEVYAAWMSNLVCSAADFGFYSWALRIAGENGELVACVKEKMEGDMQEVLKKREGPLYGKRHG